LEEKYTLTVRENIQLKEDFKEQELITADIRQEASNLLQEVKTLSVENASLRGAKEKNQEQINQLFDQIQEWKNRHQEEQEKNRTLVAEVLFS
jgi:hypothetical protein